MKTPSHPVLQARQLCFGWPDRPLFHQLSFDIAPGLNLVQGDDGSGKTTLLRLLAGELTPQSGSLSRPGNPKAGPHANTPHPPTFWIDPQTQAHDAHSAAAYLEHLRPQHPHFDADLLADLIDGFALAPHLHKPLYMLSAGSKRKVWLSAAMAAGTPLTLIDQPFSALDAPSMRLLTELLQEAAHHPSRAWVVADYEAPAGVALAGVVRL